MKKPIQAHVDEELFRELEAWAEERGWTKSDAIRAAIRLLVRTPESEPLLAASGMIHGLPDDLSERVDEQLGETFFVEAAPHARTG